MLSFNDNSAIAFEVFQYCLDQIGMLKSIHVSFTLNKKIPLFSSFKEFLNFLDSSQIFGHYFG